MKNSGTTSQVAGIYVEFQAAVIKALPRDIDQDVALGWTQNSESLARILRKALTPDGKPVSDTYLISVDYGRNVEDGVEAGRYHWANSNITSERFPTERKGTAKVEVKLIHFNWSVSTNKALRELDRMGYRPAELHELLALGEKYQEIQRKFPIVALGSVLRNRCVLGLSGDNSRRYLNLYLNLYIEEHHYGENCRFAAVCK